MRAKIKDLTLTELFEKTKKLDFQVFLQKKHLRKRRTATEVWYAIEKVLFFRSAQK